MKIKFNPEQCVGCLVCMSVKKECRLLIDMIRRGGPRFGEERCDASACTKCIDMCSTHALTLRK